MTQRGDGWKPIEGFDARPCLCIVQRRRYGVPFAVHSDNKCPVETRSRESAGGVAKMMFEETRFRQIGIQLPGKLYQLVEPFPYAQRLPVDQAAIAETVNALRTQIGLLQDPPEAVDGHWASDECPGLILDSSKALLFHGGFELAIAHQGN